MGRHINLGNAGPSSAAEMPSMRAMIVT